MRHHRLQYPSVKRGRCGMIEIDGAFNHKRVPSAPSENGQWGIIPSRSGAPNEYTTGAPAQLDSGELRQGLLRSLTQQIAVSQDGNQAKTACRQHRRMRHISKDAGNQIVRMTHRDDAIERRQ